MSTVINGTIIFDENEFKTKSHPALAELEGLNFGDVWMPYGFSIQTIDGRRTIVAGDRERYILEMKNVEPGYEPMPDYDCRPLANPNDPHELCYVLCARVGMSVTCRKARSSGGYYYCGCFKLS